MKEAILLTDGYKLDHRRQYPEGTITLGLEMISAPNTIENVIGFFMVVATLYLSVRTKCLTAIKLERKHEK